MELSRRSATEIVREINSVLPQKINLMNKRGIIIASTDPQRVGTFHGGAARIIRENLAEVRIYHGDEYEGARPGTNFLLCTHDEPIGVLGITGNYDDILPLAKVIKKMTELLVEEQELQYRHVRRESLRNRFLTEFLTDSGTSLNHAFYERGLRLGIDLRLPRRVLAAAFVSAVGNQDMDQSEAEDIVIQAVQQLEAESLACRMVSSLAILVRRQDDGALRELAEKLQDEVAKRLPGQLVIGVDSPAQDYLYSHDAWLQAQKALQSCLRRGKTSLKFYDEINMEIFADELPDTAKLAYIHKIFAGYGPAEFRETMEMLERLYENDGSITHTAAQLFIHKNTLQQHLRKVAARTGYDPRSLRSSAIFYIVIYFYHDLKNAGHLLP